MALNGTELPGQEEPEVPAGEPASTSNAPMASEAVRNSPEYKELQRQLRNEARTRGQFEREARDARAQAERARLEAEQREQDALQNEIVSLLGEDGLAAWDEFATLSQTDPRGAARKWAELTGKLAEARETQQTPPEVPVTTPAQPTPQPVTPQPRTVDAGAPLTSVAAPDPDDAVIADREARWNELTERNLKEPNRVTERERADGIMGYMEVGYRKALRALRGT